MAFPDWVRDLLARATSDPKAMVDNLTKVRAEFPGKLRRVARRVPFSKDLLAAYYCALDPDTPQSVRATLLAALAYFILPLDTVPDFILGLGFGDDSTVLMAALSLVAAHVTDRHRDAAQATLDDDGTVSEDFGTQNDAGDSDENGWLDVDYKDVSNDVDRKDNDSAAP